MSVVSSQSSSQVQKSGVLHCVSAGGPLSSGDCWEYMTPAFNTEVSFPFLFCFPDFCNAASACDSNGKRHSCTFFLARQSDAAAL